MALSPNSVDVALTRLERMEEAIQEMRLILSRIAKGEQMCHYTFRSTKRSKASSGSPAKREVQKQVQDTDTKLATDSVISEAMKLITRKETKKERKKKIESEKSYKTVDLTETKKDDETDQNTQVKQWEKSLTETKTVDKEGENPNEDFWFSLAKQEIFKTR